MRILAIVGCCGWLAGLITALPVTGLPDLDGDGVVDSQDICNNTPPGVLVDLWGRPYADLDQECDVDLSDFQFLLLTWTGPMPIGPFLGDPDNDTDGDGVNDARDVCDNTPPGILVDYWGRPYGDFDGDCDVDLEEFAFFQSQFTGPLPTCPEGFPCDDGLDCTVNDTCISNACIGTPDDALCDDGVFCNGAESCSGEFGCQDASPVDCSDLDGPCVDGVCDEVADACVTIPVNEAQPCEDGSFCTVGETCTAGVCGDGVDRDCSELDTTCTLGVCDEQQDACMAAPINDGGDCDDGLFCTIGETCLDGECGGGLPRDCSDLDDQCAVGACDESTDACEVIPLNEGGDCDDGLFCTTSDTCSAGQCVGGQAVDCSDLDTDCLVGVCDDAADMCVESPRPNGTLCNDGSSCTLADTCSEGVCSDVALPDQTPCDDGDPGTDDSICVSGNCAASILYELSTNLSYNCPFGVVFNVSDLLFADDGVTLTVFGAPAVMSGAGGIGVNDPFSVTGSVIDGECTQVFTLAGQFNGDGTWNADFAAEFYGCGGCGWPTWSDVLGTPAE